MGLQSPNLASAADEATSDSRIKGIGPFQQPPPVRPNVRSGKRAWWCLFWATGGVARAKAARPARWPISLLRPGDLAKGESSVHGPDRQFRRRTSACSKSHSQV